MDRIEAGNKISSYKYTMLLFGGVLFFLFIYFYEEGVRVFHLVSGIDFIYIFTGLALVVCNYLLRTQRWRIYLSIVMPMPSFKNSFTAFIVGLVGCLTPGKVGEVSRCWSGFRYGISWKNTLATLLVERISDVLAVLTVAMIGVFLSGNADYNAPLLALIIFVALLSVLISTKVFENVVAILPFFGKRISGWLPEKFWLILQGSQKGKVALSSAALAFVGWFLEALCLYIIAIGVGANLGVGVCMLAFGVGILAGALSLMPGGLGSTEVVMVTILCWAGCTPAEAIAIVLVFRAMTLWFGFLMGMFVFSLQKAGKV